MNNGLYRQIAEVYNREQGTGITLKEDSTGSLTPVIELSEQEVIFNPHYQTLLTLLNMFTLHKREGSRAVHHFLLYHLALRKNMYEKADELLGLLNEDVENLCEIIDDKDRLFYSYVAEFQLAFVLTHEFSHIFYHLHPDVLEANQRIQKENLIWLRKQLDTGKLLLAKMLHTFIPRMQHIQEHSFDEAISTPNLQEELLCDDAAWHMTHHLIQSGIFDSEQRAVLSAYVAFAIHYMEIQRTLENIYMTANNQERQRHLMFDTTRSTVFVNTVWDDVPHEAVKQYQSLVNDLSRMGRVFLMLPLRANAEHIGYIRLLPKKNFKYSVREVNRLDVRYEEVASKLQMTQN